MHPTNQLRISQQKLQIALARITMIRIMFSDQITEQVDQEFIALQSDMIKAIEQDEKALTQDDPQMHGRMAKNTARMIYREIILSEHMGLDKIEPGYGVTSDQLERATQKLSE
jgi:hypothetical protein